VNLVVKRVLRRPAEGAQAVRRAQDDDTLFAGAATGDLDSFEVLVSRYSSAVLWIVRSHVGDGALADDVVVAVFCQVWHVAQRGVVAESFVRVLSKAIGRCLSGLDRLRRGARSRV
jgi:DNA-directed RNA polymerase specialized sigma24 family protein